jgi:hypothetical protein
MKGIKVYLTAKLRFRWNNALTGLSINHDRSTSSFRGALIHVY